MADRSVVYRLRADVTQFKAQMASAAASVTGAADKMTAADKSGAKFRTGLTTLGSAAGKVGLVAAVGLGAAVIKAANFDQAMSRVAAATHESAGNMELLRTAALKAGAQTVFSATESADAITAMSKAGVSAKDILSGGLSGALALASAGELDVAQAADIAATAMNQFGLGGKDVGHIADLLAAGAGKAQGEVTDFSEALKFVGPVAHQMGISIEETTGTIAELATQGILGEQAGTGLRGMLLSLSAPSTIAAKEMQKLGINVYDAQGQFVGFNGVAEQMHQSMTNLSAAERDQAFGRIFGNAQVTTARILYAGGAADVDKWTSSVNDSGYAAETAKIKLNNLKGDLEQLGGSLETALIGTGSSSQGPLRGLVQGLTDVVNMYNKLPGAAKSGVGVILGGIAAIGGSVYIFSKVVQGVAATRLAMDQLGLSMGKTGGAAPLLGARLGLIATKAVGIAAVGIAVGALADNIGRIDASKIDRSLDALVRGDSTDTIDKLVSDMASLSSWTNKIDLGEVVTLFGVFGDSTLDKQAQNLEQVDSALASMVEGGNIDQARSSFAALSAEAEKQGVSFGDLVDRFPEYATAMRNAGIATNDISGLFLGAASASAVLAGATGGATNSTSQNTTATKANAEAQKAASKAAAATAHSFLALGKGLNDAKVGLNQWIHQLSNQADALNHFTANSLKAANKGLRQGLIKALQEAGPEGALRMKQLANASDKEIGKANHAWAKGQRAVKDYTNTVARVPGAKATKVSTPGAEDSKSRIRAIHAEIDRLKDKTVHARVDGADEARAKIGRLRAELASLHDRTITLNFHGVRTGAAVGGKTALADGGQVSGPGGPRDDVIPALLSNGEFVVNAAATARNLTLLHQINAQRFADGGRVQRFADGGAARRNDDSNAHHVNRFAAALREATKAINKEKSAREKLVSKRNDLSSTVSGTFLTDPFAGGNVWAAGGGSPLAILKADIAKAKAFRSQLGTLKHQGLKGDALASIASTGDVGKAAALASTGKAGVAQFQSAFNQRASIAASVGAFAGTAAWGPQIAVSNRHLAALNKKVDRLHEEMKHHPERTGKAAGKEINHAAASAKRSNR